jgi:ribosomal protein S18 acetylase RimI-like enzyme
MKIEYTEKVDKFLEDFVSVIHSKNEKENNALCNYKKFAFYIKENEKIVGCLIGCVRWICIYIDNLGVDEKYRGKGYGKKLLEKVEEHFKGTKYKNIALCTNGFQAPEFYKKCGYELEFVREYKDSKFNKYFFNKWIN